MFAYESLDFSILKIVADAWLTKVYNYPFFYSDVTSAIWVGDPK